jgi:hypothetical protein
MTLAVLLVVVGAWLLHISRPRPRPPSRPGIIIDIAITRVPR